MINWKFNPEDCGRYEILQPGIYRVRISEAKEKQSKSGRDMIELTLQFSGSKVTLRYYLVFLPDYPQITNSNLGAIYDSFAITPGNLDINTWINRAGAAEIISEKGADGTVRNSIKRFISRNHQDQLPPWQDKATPKSAAPVNPEMIDPTDEVNVPF